MAFFQPDECVFLETSTFFGALAFLAGLRRFLGCPASGFGVPLFSESLVIIGFSLTVSQSSTSITQLRRHCNQNLGA
jgi:hypothetical protein